MNPKLKNKEPNRIPHGMVEYLGKERKHSGDKRIPLLMKKRMEAL